MLLKADIWHHIILLQVHQRNIGKQNIGLDLKHYKNLTRTFLVPPRIYLFDLHT